MKNNLNSEHNRKKKHQNKKNNDHGNHESCKLHNIDKNHKHKKGCCKDHNHENHDHESHNHENHNHDSNKHHSSDDEEEGGGLLHKNKKKKNDEEITCRKHDHHDSHDDEEHVHTVKSKFIDLRIKFLIGIVFLIPAFWIMIYTISSQSVFIPTWIINPIFQLISATIVLFLFSFDIIKNSIEDVKSKKIGIDFTITVAVLFAYFYSLVIFIINMINNDFSSEGYFFDSVIEILVIVFIGVIIDNIAVKKAKNKITSINEMIVQNALVLVNKKEVNKNIEDIKIGDILIVKAGDRIALDGKVISGITEVNESAFTGESLSIIKKKDSHVFGGTISQTGTIHVEVQATLEETMVSKILKGIAETRRSKPKTQILADKIGSWFMPFLLMVSFLGFIGWGLLTLDWYKAISVFITTIIIACPMAFVLITPFVSLFTNQTAIKNNIQLQSKALFEEKSNFDLIFFDKTGTLTKGEMNISKNTIDKKYKDLLCTMESNSNHSISKSVIRNFNNDFKKIDGEFNSIPGKGSKFITKDETYYLGSYKFLKEFHKDYKFEINVGETASFLFTKDSIIGFILLQDEIKENTKKAIDLLNKKNIKPIMLTGDNKDNAIKIADELGIEEFYYEMLPDQKVKKLKEYHDQGYKICFVGDGINDSIAIESANLGIAMSSGTDVAKTTSDVIILDDDLVSVVNTIDLMKKANRTIKFGLMFSVFWVMIAISFSISGFLIPAFGAIGMVINDTLPLLYGLRMRFVRFGKKK